MDLTRDADVEYCYGHPKTPTKLHCSRCDKPICPRCSVPAAVGQHCVWCVAEARKNQPKVRTALQGSSPAVYAIIIASVAVYVLEVLLGDEFILKFAASPANIAFAQEYYRLLTPMFLHAPLGTPFGIMHILFNMYILAIYGPQVEHAFGPWRFLAMYVTAGFLGGAASFAFGSCASLGLGASGAVFGVVGILLAFLYRRRDGTLVNQYIKTLLIFVGINLLFGFSVRGIDNFAHLGGLASGLMLGAGMDAGRGQDASPARQMFTLAAVIAIGAALVAWRIAAMPASCVAFLR